MKSYVGESLPSRVAVVGTTGAGKTTFARPLAEIVDAKHVELDALYHGPNWTPSEPDVRPDRVGDAIACERWVTDGNYGDARPLVWAAADSSYGSTRRSRTSSGN